MCSECTFWGQMLTLSSSMLAVPSGRRAAGRGLSYSLGGLLCINGVSCLLSQ